METQHDLTLGDEQFATLQEARSAIEDLQNTDYKKLMRIARYFAENRLENTIVEPDDLLYEAIVKTLDGRRRWNRRVSIIKHLDRVMESDSGHEADKRAARGFSQLSEDSIESADQKPSPETRLLVLDELEGALELFAGDEIALKLLRLKSDYLSPSEIRLELGMSKVEYDTVTRRIRRRLAKYLAEGNK